MAIYQLTSGRQVSLRCMICTEPFTYVTKSKGRYARFCSQRCRDARNTGVTLRSRERRRGLWLPQPRQRQCVECGKTFATTLNATICCGVKCGSIRAKRESDASRTANANKRRERVCEICERIFVMHNPSGRARGERVGSAHASAVTTPSGRV